MTCPYALRAPRIVACMLPIAFCLINGCESFLDVDAPVTSVNQANIYQSDAGAISALNGIYVSISGSVFSGDQGLSMRAGFSADELTWYGGATGASHEFYYWNKLNAAVASYWPSLYTNVFYCNAAIEGLSATSALTAAVKQQLLGEAKFMRAFFYFYLVNLYGDVPVAITIDPNVNALLARSPKPQVYQQIISDLMDAQNLLSTDYLNGQLQPYSERLRPTKWAATALLARAYLYTGDYANAETHATTVMSGPFGLSALNSVFLRNSSEAIWQLQPVRSGRNTEDALAFIILPIGPSNNVPSYLSPQLLNAFEPADQRRVIKNWVDSITVGSTTYYFPYKYKSATQGAPVTEYLMMLRLGEQYLIRAEARARLGNVGGAQADLNTIRTRAGLPNTTANDQNSLIAAILKERQVELFAEMGHRWLDLKRTATVDAVMTVVTPVKSNGAAWQPYQQLYPIPLYDIQRGVNLVQNPGY